MLTASQQAAFDAIFDVSDNETSGNEAIFSISGCPGTGKTYLIRSIHEKLKERNEPHYILAPTNVAAEQIGGKTIHSIVRGGTKLIQFLEDISRDKHLASFWSSKRPFEAVKNSEFASRIKCHLIAHGIISVVKPLDVDSATFCSRTKNKTSVRMPLFARDAPNHRDRNFSRADDEEEEEEEEEEENRNAREQRHAASATDARRDGNERKITIIIDEIGLVSIPTFYFLLYMLAVDDVRLILFGDEHQIEPIGHVNKSLFDIFARMKFERDEIKKDDERRVEEEKRKTATTTTFRQFYLKENVRHGRNEHFQKFIADWYDEERSGSEIPHLRFGGTEKDFFALRLPKLAICGRNETVSSYREKMLADIDGDPIVLEPTVKIVWKSEVPATAILSDMTEYQNRAYSLRLKPGVPISLNDRRINAQLGTAPFKFKSYDAKRDAMEILDRDKRSHFVWRAVRYVNVSNLHAYEVRHFDVEVFLAVTVHKVQGLTINHPVLVKYSDFWTEKQAYVAVSRCTFPSLIYSDVSPLLYPASLSVYLANKIESSENREKKCSVCRRKRDDVQLIEEPTRRRLTDETLNLSLICETCLRNTVEVSASLSKKLG